MAISPEFISLDSPAKCAELWAKYPEKVVGLLVSALPRQNVDVLWQLRQNLIDIGVPTVLFFNKSAKNLLLKLFGTSTKTSHLTDIYHLDDIKLFPFLNFVEVLVSNDYVIDYMNSQALGNPHTIGAKLVNMPHTAHDCIPGDFNFYFDYYVAGKGKLNLSFPYRDYPDGAKIHRNLYLTQLVAGSPKLDLLLQERSKNESHHPPILLLYPTGIWHSMELKKCGSDDFVKMWSEAAEGYLKCRPQGLVVFRPWATDKQHSYVKNIMARFANEARFIVDMEDDNKFWLARADYFVTDYSQGFVNFVMTAKKPAIRMQYKSDAIAPQKDEWGWVISKPDQIMALLDEMDQNGMRWAKALHEKQQQEMPTLGQNFPLIAAMIKRIFNHDDDPSWPKMSKAHTPCRTPSEMLKLVAKMVRNEKLNMINLGLWLTYGLQHASSQETPKIWLNILKFLFLQTKPADPPNIISVNGDIWIENAYKGLPFCQTIGVLRHAMRMNPQKAGLTLLQMATSTHLHGQRKRRALFLLLMELPKLDSKMLYELNFLALQMPQHFSRPVLKKINRFLPYAMALPQPLRRYSSRILGLKKTLARKYWDAHRALA